MPGFMGLRGLERKNVRDLERERRHERDPKVIIANLERRSRAKALEILRDQGQPSAPNPLLPSIPGECEKIADYPVSDIMSDRVAVLSFDDTLLTVKEVFSCVRFHHLPVVDEDGNIIGIVSDRDFLRLVSPFYGTINEQNRDIEIMNKKAGMVMTRHPICITADTTILAAVLMLNQHRISCLPVLEDGGGKLLGMITWKDIVRAFCPRAFRPSDSQRLRCGLLPGSGGSAATAGRPYHPATEGSAVDNEEDRRINLKANRYDLNPSLSNRDRPDIPFLDDDKPGGGGVVR